MRDDQQTPLRRSGGSHSEVLQVLSEPAIAYADGGESSVLSILAAASDLSSASDELAAASIDWPTEYATSRSRANFLRALEIPSEAVVLEVGGGQGAISRYLGETCAVVDMVEPVRARAEAGAMRNRDLPNVRIFQGVLDDVPEEQTYDIVVVCGVLEYIGSGSKSSEPYVTFLKACAARLKPTGSLILAIENALGVKYLSGASEDHTGRPFDSLEGYLLPSGARTFTRPGLEALVRAAGLNPTTYGAFPDYKLTRAVVSSSLIDAAPEAMADIPAFPSRDYSEFGVEGADERALWGQLVEAGTAFEHCNSWLVLATKGERSLLWPSERLASLVLAERGAAYLSRTDFVRSNNNVTVTRRSLTAPSPADAPFVWIGGEESLIRGPLLSSLVDDDSTRGQALRDWKRLVEETPDGAIDLMPWNVVVTDEGLVAIDQEWQAKDFSAGACQTRGLVLSVARWARERRWPLGHGTATVLDTVRSWAAEAEVQLTDSDISQFIDREAAFQELLAGPPREEGRVRIETLLASHLCDVRGSTRLDQGASGSPSIGGQAAAAVRLSELEIELARHQAHRAEVEVAFLALEDERHRLEVAYGELESSCRGLESSYIDLEASYHGLEGSYRGLEGSYLGLEAAHHELEAAHHDLEVTHHRREATLAQLEETLDKARSKPFRFALAATRQRLSGLRRRTAPPA